MTGEDRTYWQGQVAQRLDGIDAALNRIETVMNDHRLKDELRLSTLELQLNEIRNWRSYVRTTMHYVAAIWTALFALIIESLRQLLHK